MSKWWHLPKRGTCFLYMVLGASAGLAGPGPLGGRCCRGLVQGCRCPAPLGDANPAASCACSQFPCNKTTELPSAPWFGSWAQDGVVLVVSHAPRKRPCPGFLRSNRRAQPRSDALSTVLFLRRVATALLLHGCSCLPLRSLAHTSMRLPQPAAAKPPGRPQRRRQHGFQNPQEVFRLGAPTHGHTRQ